MVGLWVSLAMAGTGDGRLHNTLHPVSQAVQLTLDPGEDRYEGTVTIDLEVDEKTNAFTLHAEGLKILDVVAGNGKMVPAGFTAHDNLLYITPTKLLRPGKATVEIRFENDVSTDVSGLYRSVLKDDPYLVTQFEADDARTAFPCFDEPAFKIPWAMELTTPTDLVAVTNMPVQSSYEQGTNTVRQFAVSPPMPSYLVAVAVGPFEATTVEASKPVTIYSPKGTAPLTAEMADQIPVYLDYLADWFGSPLPYAKLDFVVVPEFSYGGMENVGLVVLADTMLLDPATQTPEQAMHVGEVIAHEIAHMWFGNLVTMAWWDDLWLNESFASWMGLKARAAARPDHPGVNARVWRAFGAMRADGRSTMRPVRTKVDPAHVFETTNFLAYPKGQSMLSSVEQWLGTPVFQKGVRDYMTTHRFANATSADLFAALTKASGEDVEALMEPYLNEAGAPLLLFTRTSTGFDVTQSRYQAIGSELDASRTWPVAMVGRSGDTEVRQLVKGTAAVAVEGDWFLPMVDGVGYFAWDFADPADLDALVAAADQLSVSEQLALVENLSTLTAGGRLSMGRQLELFGELVGKVEVPVERSILYALYTVEEVVDDELKEDFGSYLQTVFGPRLDVYGLEDVDGESPQMPAGRSLLIRWLGQHAKDERVLAHWQTVVEAFLADPGSVPYDIAKTALREHAKTQDVAFQDAILARAESSDDPRMARLFLGAFALVKDPAARARTQTWMLEEERQYSDLFAVLNRAFGDTEAERDAALDFTIEHWAHIADRMPPQRRGGMLWMGAGCSTERFDKAKAFFTDKKHALSNTDRIAGEVEESVKACQARQALHRPSLKAFFDSL